ncbi:hypothetical protein BSKO_08458 [Bryopsis sp. KO-2023]|nr:hypothetical protein BSKO_08458 [Bryopsis sp. KO-2023]
MAGATQPPCCEVQRSGDSGSCLTVHKTILNFLRNCGRTRRGCEVDVGHKDGVGGLCRESESTDHPSTQSGGSLFKDDGVWSLASSSTGLGTMVEEDLAVDAIVMGKTLGRGHFGSVHQAFLNGKLWAIKIIKHEEDADELGPAAEMLLQGIAHPNLVQIYGVKERLASEPVENDHGEARISFQSSTDRDSVDSWCRSSGSSDFLAYLTKTSECRETWVFMEYCDMGSLWDAVHRGDFSSCTKMQTPCWLRIVSVALEVARALAHLHASGIIHGDLKPQNVLLKTCEDSAKGFVAKVGDFGLSRQNMEKTHLSIVCHGTVDHMPPEVLKDSHMSAACDVFSFGMLLWEIIAGQKPFKGLQQAAIVVAIVEGHRPALPASVPKPLGDLIQDCWQQDPQARPSFSIIVRRLEDLAFLATKWERNATVPTMLPRKGVRVPPTDCAHSERYMQTRSDFFTDDRLSSSWSEELPYVNSRKTFDCNLE